MISSTGSLGNGKAAVSPPRKLRTPLALISPDRSHGTAGRHRLVFGLEDVFLLGGNDAALG